MSKVVAVSAKKHSRRLRPSTYSIQMKEPSAALPTSWIVMMLGWFNAEAARASTMVSAVNEQQSSVMTATAVPGIRARRR